MIRTKKENCDQTKAKCSMLHDVVNLMEVLTIIIIIFQERTVLSP